jgi:osmotically-inducible protein OsmY
MEVGIMRTLEIGKFVMVCLVSGFLCYTLTSLAVAQVNDGDISAAIQKRALADWGVRSKLDVEVKNGIVRLSGIVGNILADERAVEIAKSTRGVRAVIDMIMVDVVDKKDEEINREVISALEKDPAVDRPDIDVKVLDGFITLSGTVDSFTEKHLAWRASKAVEGVTGVRNDILVERRPERPDSEIKADVEGRLRDSVLIDSNLIKVSVKDGRVKLAGSVGSDPGKRRVKWTVESVFGVKSADDSELAVKALPGDEMRRSGYFEVAQSVEAVKNAVRDALLYDPRVDPSGINVEVVIPKGTVDVSIMANVTLAGTVDSLMAKSSAGADAGNTIGVSLVKNNLVVSEGGAASDLELLDKVEKALLADPQLGSFRLRVGVLNGNIRLSGTVSSDSDKKHAEDIVSEVKGVVAVQNSLKIQEQ